MKRFLLIGLAIMLTTAAHAADTIRGDRSTPVLLSLPSSFGSRIDSRADSDWVKVKLTKGQNILIRQYTNCMLEDIILRDPTGKPLVTVPLTTEHGGAVEFTPRLSGTYFISASTQGRLHIDCSDWYEPAYPDDWSINIRRDCGYDARTTCKLTTSGKPVNGTIDEYNDKDWFAIDVPAPATYTLKLLCGYSYEDDCTNYNLTLSLRRSNSTTIGEFHDDFTISLAKGRHYIAVRGGYDDSNYFRLTLQKSGASVAVNP